MDLPAKKEAVAATLRQHAARLRAAIEEAVAKAPPLSDEQRRELANLLRPLP